MFNKKVLITVFDYVVDRSMLQQLPTLVIMLWTGHWCETGHITVYSVDHSEPVISKQPQNCH